MSPELVSLTDEKCFPLNRPSIFIGRDRWRVDVCLSGDAVEEVHCELIQHGTGFRVINLSDSGTLVNGQPVTEAVLQDGDELTIATYRLRLSCSARAGEARIGVRSDDSAEQEWAALHQGGETPEEPSEPRSFPAATRPEVVPATAGMWQIQLAGLELGPMPWNELNEMVETGQAQPTDPVRSSSSPEWRPFSEVVATGSSAPSSAISEKPLPQDPSSLNAPDEASSNSDSVGQGTGPDPKHEPAFDADLQFFVMLGETETGPVPLEVLQQLALEYRLTGVTLVREESETEWTPAGALPIDFPPPVEVQAEQQPEEKTEPKREQPPATPLQQFRVKLTWLLLSPIYYLANGLRVIASLSPRTLAVGGVAAVILGSVAFFWFRGWSQTALTGTLTMDGEPVPSMLVTLTGMSTGDSAVGFTDSNGRFSARTLDGDLLPGRYHVTVEELPGADSDQAKEEKSRPQIPRKFESLGTTDIIIEVTPESSSVAIALKASLKGSGISLER